MMDGERKTCSERILSAIEFGKLSNEETERRLKDLIDAEIVKTDAPADLELIKACQSLLWQLHTHGAIAYDSHKEKNLQEIKARIHKRESCKECGFRWCKRGISVAAVLVLILGLCGKLEWSWFEHKTSPDEQQFTVVGHEVSVDMISSAIAEHRGDKVFSTQRVEDVDAAVGFATGIPPQMAGTYEFDSCTVMFLPNQISLMATYTMPEAESRLMYSVYYFADMSQAYVSFEQSEEHETINIMGTKVYQMSNKDYPVATWMNDTSVHSITGQIDAEKLQCIVRSLIKND